MHILFYMYLHLVTTFLKNADAFKINLQSALSNISLCLIM